MSTGSTSVVDTSQNLEITRIFNLISDHPNKIIVDVGANDGHHLSNSYPLIQLGWSAVLLEPNPLTYQKAAKLHEGNPRVAALNLAASNWNGEANLYADSGGFEGDSTSSTLEIGSNEFTDKHIKKDVYIKTRVATLSSLLGAFSNIPRNFCLLSVDTEGHDLEAIAGLNLSEYRPAYIITEKHFYDFPKALKKQQLLTHHGYACLTIRGSNEIWINTECEYVRAKVGLLHHVA